MDMTQKMLLCCLGTVWMMGKWTTTSAFIPVVVVAPYHHHGSSSSLATTTTPRRSSSTQLHFLEDSFVSLEGITSTYAYCLDHFYLATQSATGGIFSMMGDTIAQAQDLKNKHKNPPHPAHNNDNDIDKDNHLELQQQQHSQQPTTSKMMSMPLQESSYLVWWNTVAFFLQHHYNPTRTFHFFLKGLGGGIIWACWFDTADAWTLDLTHNVLNSLPLSSLMMMNNVHHAAAVAVEDPTTTTSAIMAAATATATSSTDMMVLSPEFLMTTVADTTSTSVATMYMTTTAAALDASNTMSDVPVITTTVSATAAAPEGGEALAWMQRVTRTMIAILLEQFLVCPLLYCFWDIPLPALLAGAKPLDLKHHVQTKLPTLLVENAKVWTPVNIITYNLPVEVRVLFTSCADIVWQSILAGITTTTSSPSTTESSLSSSSQGNEELLSSSETKSNAAAFVDDNNNNNNNNKRRSTITTRQREGDPSYDNIGTTVAVS